MTVHNCSQVRAYITLDSMGEREQKKEVYTQAMRAQTNADVPNLLIRSRT